MPMVKKLQNKAKQLNLIYSSGIYLSRTQLLPSGQSLRKFHHLAVLQIMQEHEPNNRLNMSQVIQYACRDH